MALILTIETSTKVCSVAVHKDSELKGYSEIHIQKSHSQVLTLLIRELCKNSGFRIKDLDAVAVSEGPGSYTGLRIGVSTAKGLCYGLDKPLIPVNTLLSMTAEVNRKNFDEALLVPMIDARRMEVYCGVFDHTLQALEEIHPHVLTEDSFAGYLKDHRVIFFGDGSEKARDVIRSENACFIRNIYPSAKWVGELAERFFTEKRFADIAYFEPFYLKEFSSTARNFC